MTNMHTRNLALVWAPNLLRSKEIESVGCNGDAAFLEVRVQQLVIEFILNHVDEIFSDNATARPKEDEENKPIMKSLTLPPSASLPMKLVSLEEAQARSLSACHPARKERRENSLPEIVPVTGSFFHTVLDLPDSKRKLSTKSKKWKSIFNLGRSGSEAKTKLSRNGSVFVRGQKLSEKVTIRPAKSMDSLCSIPVEEDEKGNFKRTVMAGGFFVPMMKPRMGGLSNSPDVSKQEAEWDPKEDVKGAEGGTEDNGENNISRPSQARPLPEQLKVFRAIEDPESEQTSPKMCRMFYTSNDGTAKSGFHGTLFPLEASPRHQRKALNISEPFAVSVPLRVSAVISINSTPCRSPAKDKPAFPSLQESPLLGQDSAISAATEGDDNSRLEQSTVKEEKKPESKVVVPDTTAEEPAIPKKPEPIDDAQPATKTQETKSGWGNGSQAPQIKQSLEQRQLVKIPGDQQEEDEARHGQLGVNDQPEQDCQQQELLRDKVEDTLHLKELASDENSSAALESPWQDVQQELKIVESEEELPFTATAPEKVKLQESESSLIIISPSEVNSVVCGSVLPLTRLKEESIVGTTSTMSHFPLFGISSKGSKDSMVCNPELFRKQGGASFILPKLENIPYGISCPKDCLKDEDTKSDISLPQEQKLPSKPLARPALLRDELSSQPKEKDLDDPEWKSNSWILQKKKQGTAVTKVEESDKEFSKRGDLANSKILTGVGSHQLKESRLSNQAQDPLDQQDEDSCLNHVQNLELVEPWEEHQWVTSPLHSPTFKGTQEKALLEFEPQNQGKAQSHFKKPFFSRSFSLDSKDFVKRHWGTSVPSISANEEHLCNNTRSGAREHSATQEREAGRVEAWLNLSNESSKLVGRIQKPLCQETDFAAIELPLPQFIGYQESAEKEVHEGKENQDLMNHMESSLSQFSTGDSLFNSSGPLKDTTFVQQADSSATAVMKDSVGEPQGSKNEDIPRRERPRPSSLNLDSVLPAASFFNFESLSVPTPPRHFLCGQKDVKTSDSVPSLPVACPSKSKADLWGSHFDPQELDYIMMAHATTGRRNSAPVSVSAVRTSFLVKMCQARAVPVIPPKIQYTQVPLPLQTQNSNCRTQLTPEDKEVEATVSQCKSNKNAQGQMQSPKSPSVDRKGKENNTATFLDSPATRKVESSFSNHNSTQDAPVLRRKRTSEGETTGDNPQSSKMERPSGVSKPSYRSRPGRPQSLILFSPPFPIMDHPSSSADSRVLLSPIRSPSQSPSTSPISSDLSGTVAEGVMLRNKMTIPKNGQRLETSTSCFYQPQRRSVILDGRSGRQIE